VLRSGLQRRILKNSLFAAPRGLDLRRQTHVRRPGQCMEFVGSNGRNPPHDRSVSVRVSHGLPIVRACAFRSIDRFHIAFVAPCPYAIVTFELGICESLVALSSFVNQYTSHSRCICNASRVEHFNQIYLFYFEDYISCPMQHRTYIYRLLDFFFFGFACIFYIFFFESSFSLACPIVRFSSTKLEPFIFRIKFTQAPRRRAVENSTHTQNEEVDPDD